jgi:predicted amidohydrolase YtcJ
VSPAADPQIGTIVDLGAIDRDILAGGPSSILGTKVALAVVGGEVVHHSEDAG